MGWDVFYSVLKLIVEVGFVIYVGFFSGSVVSNYGYCWVVFKMGFDDFI